MSEAKKTVVFNPSDHMALIQGGGAMLEEARALVVDSTVMYEEAGAALAQVKGSIKRIETAKESLLKPVRELDRAIRSLFDPALKAREAVEIELKNKQTLYLRKVDEERAAAQRVADDNARKERERLEREATAAKAKADTEADAARKRAAEAEEAKKRAEAEGNTRAAAAAAATQAKAEEEERQKREAGERRQAELQEQASLTSAAVVNTVDIPKAAGSSVRRPWKVRVTDRNALLASIAANPAAYGHLVEIDEGKLNKMAGAQQKGLEAVLKGIEVFQDVTIAQKAA